MDQILTQIPAELISFILVALFSLVIGLSQRKVHPVNDDSRLFGTDRTFTFIGILGFILYVVAPQQLWLFAGGGLLLGAFIGINYYFKIQRFGDFGMTTIVIALITYCLAPLVMTQPAWLYLLVVVVVLIFTEMKETFSTLTSRFEKEEFIILAKFLIIAGIVLPIVPDEPLTDFISLTPYRVWLAVVVISSISYLSYLLKKFVFQTNGVLFSGVLGGLYSSTATTFILARKSKDHPAQKNQYAAGILLSTAMMYLRILILIFIFNITLFKTAWWIFLVLFAVSVLMALGILFFRKDGSIHAEVEGHKDKNPLEFRVAIIFTILYVAFTFITWFTITNFGTMGLNFLSLVVGVTDIDPFLLNLFQGKFAVTTQTILGATLQAIISNNLLKMAYGMTFGGKHLYRFLLIGFLGITLVNILLLVLIL